MNVYTVYEFLHLLAAVTWIGGGIFANFVFMPSLTALEPQYRGMMAAVIGKRFSVFAWSSALLLLLTGFLKTPSSMLFRFSSTYGIVLGVKLFVVLAMVISGILISVVFGPRVERLAPKPGEAPSSQFVSTQKQLKFFSLFSTLLGILLLFLVAVLRTTTMFG
jgi:uncharacterized membrane protein